MKIPGQKRGDVNRFKQYLNDMPGPKHSHGRFEQRSRPYGDYLYAQDRERFMVDMAEWIQRGRI